MSKSTYEQSKKGIYKYLAEKTDHISMTVPKGTKDRWRTAAEAAGLSMTKFVLQAVDDAIGVIPNVKDSTTRAGAGDAGEADADQSHDQEQ